MNIVFILQYDTAVKTFVPVMQAMHDKGHRVECFAVQESHKKKWITPEIQKMLCGFAYCIGTVYGAAHKIKSDTDAVVMGFGNRRYMRVIYRHIKTNKLQAKTVNGYVGVILSTHERPFQENILVRSKSSLIFCPGATAYRKIMDTGLCRATGCKVVNTGLPRFDALCEQKKNIGFSDVRDKILFVEQPTFPESYEERLDMCEKLVELANKNRSKKVVIKPRFKELCGHAHEPRFLLPDIISGMVDVPENLTFDYRNIYEIFPEAVCAITISSTAAIEAILYGIPTYFVKDYCTSEKHYGTRDFVAFDTVVTFDYLLGKKRFKQPKKGIAEQILKCDGKNTIDMITAIEGLV